jgi:DNA-binding FadR family transcriptional regulator
MNVTPDRVRVSLGRNLTLGMLDLLGRSIVVGDYDDKPFPTEAALSKLHGVSRSVTREAVKMLTAKGLVSARPRQGTRIEPSTAWNLFDPEILRWSLDRKLSVDLLCQFTELRIAIEPAAAALAAVHASSDDLDSVRAGHARMHAAERGDDDPLDADIAFHLAILRASGNPFFVRFEEVVATALTASIRLTNRIQGRTADLNAHRAVLSAIEARDADGARRAMLGLIEEVMALILSFPKQR